MRTALITAINAALLVSALFLFNRMNKDHLAAVDTEIEEVKILCEAASTDSEKCFTTCYRDMRRAGELNPQGGCFRRCF